LGRVTRAVPALLHALSRPSAPWTRRALWANLVGQIGIIVTGGAVRLTGSGLGCSSWPQCEPGQFTPVRREATSWHPFIEFGNRTLTGVLVVLAIGAAWVVWRQPRRPRSLRVLALVPLAGVLLQAVIGGLTVLVDLHPGWVGAHLLVSLTLVAASTALVLRERAPDGPPRWAVVGRTRALVGLLVPLTAAVATLGMVVTGSGPHSGDDDTPYRFAVDPLLVTRAHSLTVWAFSAVLVAVLVSLAADRRAGRAGPEVARGTELTWALAWVTLAQGAVGYLQYFTGLPGGLVALHMLGAALLVSVQTAQVLALRPRQAPEGPPVPAGPVDAAAGSPVA
jgi:cytochrome c oxidase assembly protein subunit 15